MNRLTSVRLPPTGADFFLLDRRVLGALLAIPEHNVSIFALVVSLGFRQTSIRYTKQSRLSGRSKWTLRRKVRLFLDSLVGFSTLPLRLATGLGFAYARAASYTRCCSCQPALGGDPVRGRDPDGWSALMVVLLVSSGSIMIVLGIFGEYLWRALEEVRGRPRFLVEDEVNLEDDEHSLPDARPTGGGPARGARGRPRRRRGRAGLRERPRGRGLREAARDRTSE